MHTAKKHYICKLSLDVTLQCWKMHLTTNSIKWKFYWDSKNSSQCSMNWVMRMWLLSIVVSFTHFVFTFSTFTCNCSNRRGGRGWSWRYQPWLHKSDNPQHWHAREEFSSQDLSSFAQKSGSHVLCTCISNRDTEKSISVHILYHLCQAGFLG